MKKLPLYGRQGRIGYALVDDDDFKSLSSKRWNLKKNGYAYRGESGKTILLHREIMGLEKGDERQVDHKNRDRLDCRRNNLRIVSPGQQTHNVFRKGNFTSQYRGVSWDAEKNKWVACVQRGGRKFYAGYFNDEGQAARAARKLRRKVLSHALD